MTDAFWTWLIGTCVGVSLIAYALWQSRKEAPHAPCTPMTRYDIDLEVDLIVDAQEQAEYERLYGRLRMRYAAMRAEEREQLP